MRYLWLLLIVACAHNEKQNVYALRMQEPSVRQFGQRCSVVVIVDESAETAEGWACAPLPADPKQCYCMDIATWFPLAVEAIEKERAKAGSSL